MGKLYIVRHAQVKIEPNVPSAQWNLSEAGVRSTEALAASESFDLVKKIWHSPEPKALQTAQVIAERASLELRMHAGLRELAADVGFLPQHEFQARVGAYLLGKDDPAFEPYGDAQARIVSAVREIVEEAKGDSVALVTHGRILTVLYSYLFGRRLGQKEWQSIPLPALSVIDTNSWQVERGFLAGVTRRN